MTDIEKESLENLEIDTKDETDFNRALQMVMLTTTGVTWEQAAQNVGLKPATRFTPRWKKLISKAQLYVNGNIQQTTQSVISTVFDAYVSMTLEQVRIALHGRLERDRIEAYKTLHEKIIDPNLQAMSNDQGQESYIKKAQHNFNPMQSLLREIVDNGGNITFSAAVNGSSSEQTHSEERQTPADYITLIPPKVP